MRHIHYYFKSKMFIYPKMVKTFTKYRSHSTGKKCMLLLHRRIAKPHRFPSIQQSILLKVQSLQTLLVLFICLYHGELYSDRWKSYLYFRPVVSYCTVFNVDFDSLTPMEICLFFLLVQRMGIPFKGSVWLQPGHC